MENWEQLIDRASIMRGHITHQVITLERMIDAYLSHYFADDPEKRDELIDVLFAASAGNGMPFEPKRNVFSIIFKKHYNPYYKKNKWFFDGISELIKCRNIVAHYLLDMSNDGQILFKETGEVRFVKFQENTIYYDFTKKKYEDSMDLAYKCIDEIMALLKQDYNFDTRA